MNELKIIEYTTTVLYEPNTWKIWISKRNNPDKEFYECWQSPGGYIEDTNVITKQVAQREILEETGIEIKMDELQYWKTEHYYKDNKWRIVYCYRTTTHQIPELTEP